MRTLSIFEKTNENFVVCLGQFDGIHIGHRTIIDSAAKLAKENGCDVALFTIKKQDNCKSLVLSFDELTFAAEQSGIDSVIYACVEENIYSVTKEEFLRLLTSNFNIKGLVFGEDYTFGYGAEGNADVLSRYCDEKGIPYVKKPLLYVNGVKVSSTAIRENLKKGDIAAANALLGGKYMMIGEVLSGRHVGVKIGFPTMNIIPSAQKIEIKDGVYKTTAVVEGKAYIAITSVGAAPTFGYTVKKVETYIPDFDKQVYGERIIIYFDRFIREIRRFDSAEQLSEQIKEDLKTYD